MRKVGVVCVAYDASLEANGDRRNLWFEAFDDCYNGGGKEEVMKV